MTRHQEQAGTACLPVSKASRLTLWRNDVHQEQAGTAWLPVSKASRLTLCRNDAPPGASREGLPTGD
jgi:hypothetical protein